MGPDNFAGPLLNFRVRSGTADPCAEIAPLALSTRRGYGALVLTLVALFATDIIWAHAEHLTVAPVPLLRNGAFVLLICGGAAVFYWRRMSAPAAVLEAAAFVVAFSFVSGLLQYMAATVRAPLWDAEFSAWDASLGFNWLGYAEWLAKYPITVTLLYVAYQSFLSQIFLTALLLAWFGRHENLKVFLWSLIITVTIVIAISAILPAEGTWIFYGVGTPDYLADLRAIRDGTMHTVNADALRGIITFPSFHTAGAILVLNMARANKFVFAATATLNGALLVAVPLWGSHYFVDMIAGAFCAVISIYVARGLVYSGGEL